MRQLPLLLLTLALTSGCQGRRLAQACERWLQNGLKAPSTYHRVSIEDQGPLRPEVAALYRANSTYGPIVDQLTVTRDTLIWSRPDSTAGRLRADSAVVRVLAVEYDASNAMGVPLRGRADCLYVQHPTAGPLPLLVWDRQANAPIKSRVY